MHTHKNTRTHTHTHIHTHIHTRTHTHAHTHAHTHTHTPTHTRTHIHTHTHTHTHTQGYCGYSFAIHDRLLLPANPQLGVLHHRGHYYAFANREAADGFASNPEG